MIKKFVRNDKIILRTYLPTIKYYFNEQELIGVHASHLFIFFYENIYDTNKTMSTHSIRIQTWFLIASNEWHDFTI